ncbi:MAG: 3-oxoacyl-ACP reductase FabG [Chloroflexi bacterium]|nr:3-oxoacyl-ACP reductase FabG [Chloroflexota bacterium]
MGKLDGRIALVTGSSRGIGRGIALALAKEGADVTVNYFQGEAEAEEVVKGIQELGRLAIAVQADVSQVEDSQRLVERALKTFGRIDILINNAGIINQCNLVDMPVQTWDRLIACNLRSVFLVTKFTLPSMLKQNSGRIINTSSTFGQKGAATVVHYSASKGGIIAFTKALAREVSSRGITVNSIAPGPVETDLLAAEPEEWKREKLSLIPVGRFAQVEDVARVAVFLSSDEGSYFTGQTLCPNGGDVML